MLVDVEGQAVAIVVSGRATKAGRYMVTRVVNNEHETWTHIPLYEWLTDRIHGEQVCRGEDSTNAKTCATIFSQNGFARVCTHLLQCVMTQEITSLVDVECTSGFHKPYTVGNTLKDALNALCDGNGGRLFNAMVFHLTEYSKDAAIKTQVDKAVEWTHAPWAMTLTTVTTSGRKDCFGFAHTMQRPQAFENFTKIWDWVDEYNNMQCPLQTPTHAPSKRVVKVAPRPSSLVTTTYKDGDQDDMDDDEDDVAKHPPRKRARMQPTFMAKGPTSSHTAREIACVTP